MDNLQQIASRLRNPQEEVRKSAVEQMHSVTDPSVLKLLSGALGDESWRVRKSAAKALLEFPDTDKVVSVLIDALYDEDNVGRRTEAVEVLISLDEKAVKGIVESINTSDPDVRKFLVDILGQIKQPDTLDVILKAVNDPEDNVRLAAIEAMGNMGGDRAYQKLLGFLNHADMTIVFSSLHALGRMGREIPLPIIEGLIGRKILHRALFEVLGDSKNQDAVRILASGLADSSRSARQAAMKSLFKIYKRNEEKEHFKNTVETEVCRKLEGNSWEEIAEFMQGNNIELKRSVAWAMGILASPKALAQLFNALDDDAVQTEVASALSRIQNAKPDWFKEELKQRDAGLQRRVTELLKDSAFPVAVKKAPTAVEMSMEEFEWFRDRIAEFGGLYFDNELKFLVERRISNRINTLNYRNFSEYISYINRPDNAKEEIERITADLATKETYFFREEFQLRAFSDEIMPALLKKKERLGENTIRIWSAGCATGEEPYTIGIIIKEMKLPSKWNIEILASDISPAALETAREGIYGQSSFRVMDDYYMTKYFTRLNGRHQISNAIKEMIKFDKLNLLACRDAPYLQKLDVIFCRNVIIYFNPQMRQKLVEDFWHLLKQGGYLLLGHSESLMNISNSFKLLHLKNDLVYQKPEADRKK